MPLGSQITVSATVFCNLTSTHILLLTHAAYISVLTSSSREKNDKVTSSYYMQVQIEHSLSDVLSSSLGPDTSSYSLAVFSKEQVICL